METVEMALDLPLPLAKGLQLLYKKGGAVATGMRIPFDVATSLRKLGLAVLRRGGGPHTSARVEITPAGQALAEDLEIAESLAGHADAPVPRIARTPDEELRFWREVCRPVVLQHYATSAMENWSSASVKALREQLISSTDLEVLVKHPTWAPLIVALRDGLAMHEGVQLEPMTASPFPGRARKKAPAHVQGSPVFALEQQRRGMAFVPYGKDASNLEAVMRDRCMGWEELSEETAISVRRLQGLKDRDCRPVHIMVVIAAALEASGWEIWPHAWGYWMKAER